MSLSTFTHPCQRPESLPLCKVSFSTFPPPTSVTYMSVSSKSGSKTPKSHQAKCHAPFSSREHVGSIMSNMSFHDVMSRHVVMSCHVVTLETCMCHCHPPMSKTRIPASVQSVIFNLPTTHLSHLHVGLVKVWLENAQITPSKVPRPLFIPRACR